MLQAQFGDRANEDLPLLHYLAKGELLKLVWPSCNNGGQQCAARCLTSRSAGFEKNPPKIHSPTLTVKSNRRSMLILSDN